MLIRNCYNRTVSLVLGYLCTVYQSERILLRCRGRTATRIRCNDRTVRLLILRRLAAADRSCDHSVSRVRVEVVKDNCCARRARGNPAGSRNHVAVRINEGVLRVRCGRADRYGLLTCICRIVSDIYICSDRRNNHTRRLAAVTAVYHKVDIACQRGRNRRVNLINLIFLVELNRREVTAQKIVTGLDRNNVAVLIREHIISLTVDTAELHSSGTVCRNRTGCVRNRECVVIRNLAREDCRKGLRS